MLYVPAKSISDSFSCLLCELNDDCLLFYQLGARRSSLFPKEPRFCISACQPFCYEHFECAWACLSRSLSACSLNLFPSLSGDMPLKLMVAIIFKHLKCMRCSENPIDPCSICLMKQPWCPSSASYERYRNTLFEWEACRQSWRFVCGKLNGKCFDERDMCKPRNTWTNFESWEMIRAFDSTQTCARTVFVAWWSSSPAHSPAKSTVSLLEPVGALWSRRIEML